jgi:hypothetical protein
MPTLTTSSGRTVQEGVLKKFEASITGETIFPADERYDKARLLWNGTLSPRRPGLIVRCRTVTDVVRSVDFARTQELAIAVRAGGHSLAGDSFCDAGVVVDLSKMKGIAIDPATSKARADAGVTVGELDCATQVYGLATVLGECSSVGIAGSTLGGGLGRLMGLYGAGVDNLLSVDLVDPKGKCLHASRDEETDLFWALRGGGGNFGIVTSLEYQLHPVGQILGGTLSYPIGDVPEVLSFLDGFLREAPDELDIVIDIGNGGLTTFAPYLSEPILNLAVSYCGDLLEGEKALKPLRSFRQPLADKIRVMSYLEMQSLCDVHPLVDFSVSGGSTVLEGGFVERLGNGAIDAIRKYLSDPPAFFWLNIEHYLHGAVCDLPSAQTAFCLRRPGYNTRVFAGWREPSQADTCTSWVNRFAGELQRFSNNTMYVNYLTENQGEAGVRTAYGSNFERLLAIKTRFDPINLFSSNRNIRPA